MKLSKAPFEQLLRITAFHDNALEKDFASAGLRIGDELHKHIPGLLHSIRVKGPIGAVVLDIGLCEKITIKCGRKSKCLKDIQFEDNCEITEIKGGKTLLKRLSLLGIEKGRKVRLMRRLPPMEYVLRLDNRRRMKLGENNASRILGHHDEGDVQQLTSAKVETDFKISGLVGGRKFTSLMKGLGVSTGDILVLEGVEHVSELRYDEDAKDDICVKTCKSGARIHLNIEKADRIEVTTI